MRNKIDKMVNKALADADHRVKVVEKFLNNKARRLQKQHGGSLTDELHRVLGVRHQTNWEVCVRLVYRPLD